MATSAPPPSIDRKEFQKLAEKLYEHGCELSQQSAPLIESIEKLVKARNKILDGAHASSRAPAVQLAFGGLRTSDAVLANSVKEIETAGSELKKTFEAWRIDIKESVEEVGEALAEIKSTGKLDEDVRGAIDRILNKAEMDCASHTFNVGAILVLDHLIHLALHDANAVYRNEKGYVRGKALASAIEILEGIANDAVHGIVVVALPHLLPIGIVIAIFKVVYEATRSRIEEASKKLHEATDEFEKLYVLQQTQEDIAHAARNVGGALRAAKESAEDRTSQLAAAVHHLKVAQLDVDSVFAAAEDLMSAKEALHKLRNTPTR